MRLRKSFKNVIRIFSMTLTHSLVVQLRKGETPGDRIQGLLYRVYKVRLKNSDSQRGKSGGYRVIYYLETEDQTVLLTIYSKSDQSDLPIEFIRRTIEDYLQ